MPFGEKSSPVRTITKIFDPVRNFGVVEVISKVIQKNIEKSV
jgi:hypothetical protein